MKRFIIFCLMITLTMLQAFAGEEDVKQEAFALYNTNHNLEALKLLENLPVSQKNEEVFVIIANIYEDKGDTNKAVENLNRALEINPEYYKAYYNLGCIFLSKKAYDLAEKNLLLAIKYNKNFPYAYYNLGTLYLRQGEYGKAKKELVKAIYLKNDEKDFYINLSYAYKFLGKEAESKKILSAIENL